MNRSHEVKEQTRKRTGHDARNRLLAGLPVAERERQLAGIPTTVLEGGEGSPVVLLHGPGEFAAKWLRVIPELAATHRVIAPDLPGHGASAGEDQALDADQVLAWMDDLIEQTCPSPPVLVGHVLGGAIAARFAVEHGDRIEQLVLVDALGLGTFWPSLRFALTMVGFLIHPSERTYSLFMRQCSFDLRGLREALGARWEAFVAYNLDCARSSKAKAARRLMRNVGVPRIPPEDLAQIAVPTLLIWGRQDRALRLQIAEDASARYGWPLHVIENCADDPPLDQPDAFLRALRTTFGTNESPTSNGNPR